jgi:hypothetical protein
MPDLLHHERVVGRRDDQLHPKLQAKPLPDLRGRLDDPLDRTLATAMIGSSGNLLSPAASRP